MVHLRKEHFPVDTYNKLKMKKFWPCKIVKRHDSRNYYEIELPTKLNISPIFNILDLIELLYENSACGKIISHAFGLSPTKHVSKFPKL